MGEQKENLRVGAAVSEKTVVDPEKTLVAPRFDAREVVTAQPVVPLADAPPVVRRERRQGTLPLVLILVSALVGGLVSVVAYRFYQQRTQQLSAREQPAANVEAPALTPEIPARAEAVETPAAAPEVVEETEPTPETEEVAEVREASATTEEEATRDEAREDRAGRDIEPARERATREERPAARPSAARPPAARRVEEITTPTDQLRVRRGDDDEARARRRAERRNERRAERRAARREGERNIDRVRAIFEGPPPTQ